MQSAGWPPWRRPTGCVVLDTGSTDGTVERLRARGAEVTVERVEPWRFDAARNRSLELVPGGRGHLCVHRSGRGVPPGLAGGAGGGPGHRTGPARRSTAIPGTSTPTAPRASCSGIEKIHARQGYRWTHPVHEVLPMRQEGWGPGPGGARRRGCSWTTTPDPAKSRAQYLPLLELSVAGGPGGRPQRPLPGPGVPVLRPVGRLHPHAEAPPVPAHRRLGG